MGKNTDKKENKTMKSLAEVLKMGFPRFSKYFVWAFFVAVWGVLVSYDADTLFRASEQSLFLFTEQFFTEAVALPAGFLSFLGTFFIQFFHYPLLGATTYVLLLYVLYWLTKKVFAIPAKWTLLALLPVVFVLAHTTQMGYWIFYIKVQGFYYTALLGTLFSLLAVWGCYKLPAGALRGVYALLWAFVAFPLLGVYALGGTAVMALSALVDTIKMRRRVVFGAVAFLVALSVVYSVPLWYYYKVYANMAVEHIHFAGTPIHQWVTYSETLYPDGIMEYWLPLILLSASYLLLTLLKGSLTNDETNSPAVKLLQYVLPVAVVAFTVVYWYNDKNFHIENSQNRAMWNEDWSAVADYAKDADVPTRQIVLNKNMALLKLGRAGEDAFKYPDGSADIAHPGVVHLTQTGGMMNYFQYGKFNFCYRWCIENSVEYGWRLEYLKHAVRCMLLSGQHKLAMRYINILKKTLFYSSWAEDMEAMVKTPSLISKRKEFAMPLLMYNYEDALELDDSFVEVYLSKSFSYTYSPNDSRLQAEAAVLFALTRKDVKLFWDAMSRYLGKGKITRVPHHFQEAILLFTNLSKDVTTNIPIDASIQRRFEAFLKKTQNYKGKKETEMAPHFVEEFGDTYWYFYFFVREIKTN